jgi:peptidyl-dipeptidase Dcp
MKKRILATLTTLSIMALHSTDTSARTNPLVDFFGSGAVGQTALPFNLITNADYEDAINAGIAQQNQEIAAIVNNPDTPTFENTIVAFDRSGKLLNGASLMLGNLSEALGDEELMDISTRVTPILSEHSSSIMLNEGLWKRIKYVYDHRSERNDLNAEDLRLLEETYKSFAESGANLEGEARERYRKLNSELSELQLKYGQNSINCMKDPSRRLWLTSDKLSGLPESIVTAARQEAKETLESEGKTDDGSLYLFTTYYPSYSPFMKYSNDREAREKLYRISNSRNNGDQYDNSLILKDIVNIRLEIAQLLGYKTYAEYALSQKMAKDPATVNNFLKQLADAYKPAMQKELKEIEEFAQQTEGADFKLQAWDYAYWSEKLRNSKYAFNDEDMRPYFEMENSIKGVLGLATKLYGYKFKENKKMPVYHPDVKVFEVMDSDGKMLGILYADFYYRAGKAQGAWMTEFRGEYREADGTRELPLISIVCNFSKPVGKEPSLLTPYEVETFLHEFGHALHGLSANTTYASLAGTNVYQDFVELFSQFNENFLTEKEYLDGFAKHYKTGKKMPQELISKFIAASQYGAAYSCVRQLNFGVLDMRYHNITEPMRATASVAEFESDALTPVKIFDDVEGCLISTNIGHLFSGSYAAGYYGYKWSELLDADAFSVFKKHGIFDKTTANKFKKMLQSGGTVDPMELYIEFKGSEPTIDALLERDGIK